MLHYYELLFVFFWVILRVHLQPLVSPWSNRASNPFLIPLSDSSKPATLLFVTTLNTDLFTVPNPIPFFCSWWWPGRHYHALAGFSSSAWWQLDHFQVTLWLRSRWERCLLLLLCSHPPPLHHCPKKRGREAFIHQEWAEGGMEDYCDVGDWRPQSSKRHKKQVKSPRFAEFLQ